jgi:hypothetical protein
MSRMHCCVRLTTCGTNEVRQTPSHTPAVIRVTCAEIASICVLYPVVA